MEEPSAPPTIQIRRGEVHLRPERGAGGHEQIRRGQARRTQKSKFPAARFISGQSEGRAGMNKFLWRSQARRTPKFAATRLTSGKAIRGI